MKTVLGVVVMALLGAGTAGCAPTEVTPTYIPPAEAQPAFRADRTQQDLDRDANRKPLQVLGFFGVWPGMKILDLYSGGGYYSEVVSGVVGSEGAVHAHNNQAYINFAADEIRARYADNRLSNVTQMKAENNEFDFQKENYDGALLILAYHDIYYVDEKNGWPKIDGPKMLAEIFAAIKPGGFLGVVDHVASSGAPAEVGGTLHRIDPARAKAEIIAAGFVFEESSDLLANPNDQYDKAMFDPAVRGKTDRFVYRFRRP